MLKCNRCGQYYIPGYLDCQCRVTAHLHRSPIALSLSLQSPGAITALPGGMMSSRAMAPAPELPKPSKGSLIEDRSDEK